MNYLLVESSDPVLTMKTKEVLLFTPELKDIVKGMAEVMRDNNGIGLAANQVGLNTSIFIWLEEGLVKHIINPVLDLTGEKHTVPEACLSLPGYYGEVERYDRVKVNGYKVSGERFSIEASGLTAQILQHEVDHLNGVLYNQKTKKVFKI